MCFRPNPIKKMNKSKTLVAGKLVHLQPHVWIGKVAKCFDLYAVFANTKTPVKITNNYLKEVCEKLWMPAVESLTLEDRATLAKTSSLFGVGIDQVWELPALKNLMTMPPSFGSCVDKIAESLAETAPNLIPTFYVQWPGGKE